MLASVRNTESYGTDTEGGRSIATPRRIDRLGRIVIPVELRNLLGLDAGTLVDFHLIDGYIAMAKVIAACALCGRNQNLREWHGKHMCNVCEEEIRSSRHET